MSREILRELVSAYSRLRRESVDVDRVDEIAARLELHLPELEVLGALNLEDDVEPAQRLELPPAVPGDRGTRVEAEGAPSPGRKRPRRRDRTGGVPPSRRETLLGAVARLRRGEQSPIELTEETLARARDRRELNAFIAIFEEQARLEAHALAGERTRDVAQAPHERALWGIPVAVKDLMAIRGYAMTGGSRALASEPAAEDAPVVARLRAAGAVVVGAANLHEFAYGVTSENPHFGTVLNPYRTDRVAGGSSGGSAASVAAGMALLSVGTDTGGSVRIPAAACGVAGLKPTYGRVSRRGVFPLAWSLDHVGPLAPCAGDLAAVLAAMVDEPTTEERLLAAALVSTGTGDVDLPAPLRVAAGLARSFAGVEPPASEPGLAARALDGLVWGVPGPDWTGPVDPAPGKAVERAVAALREHGARVTPVTLPPLSHFRVAQFVILQSEAIAVHRARLRRWWDLYGPDVRLRLKIGEFLTAADYLQGQRMRRHLMEAVARAMTGVDLLILPTLPVAPPSPGRRLIEVGETPEPVHRALTRFTAAFDLTGQPAATVPAGLDTDGLPVAVQVVGRWGREVDVLRGAIAVEWLLAHS